MELVEESKKGACRRALEKFASEGTENDSLRATILGSTFANIICNFVDKKFEKVLLKTFWDIMPREDGGKDICVGLKFNGQKTLSELSREISKFYKEVLEIDEWWGYKGKNLFVMVWPMWPGKPHPFSFKSEPADYISSRPSCDDAEASGRPKVKDETVSGPSKRGRKRRESGGARHTSSCSQKRTSLGETQNV